MYTGSDGLSRHTLRERLTDGSFITPNLAARPRGCVHLPRDSLVQAPAVVANVVEVEMAAPFDVAEVGSGPEPLHRRFQQVRHAIQIERIGRTDRKVDLAVEITPEIRPLEAEALGHVVMLPPISDHRRV